MSIRNETFADDAFDWGDDDSIESAAAGAPAVNDPLESSDDLWAADDSDGFDADAWASQDDLENTDDPEEPETLVAPSAEQIQALLGSLGGGGSKTEPPKTHVSDPPAPASQPPPPQLPVSQPPVSPAPQHDRPSGHASASPFDDQASRGGLSAADFSQAAAAIGQLDPELREAYLEDACGCVASMEAALLRLESNADDVASAQQICRELHTLKGASASVGLDAIAANLHAIEDQIRDDADAGRTTDVSTLLGIVDQLQDAITGRPRQTETPSTVASQASVSVPVSQDSSASAPAAPQVPNVSQAPAATPPTAPAAPPRVSVDDDDDDESVRVKTTQLNRLMDMLAELVMLRNRRDTEVSELNDNYRELMGSASKLRLLSNEGQHAGANIGSLQVSEVANDIFEVAQRIRDCGRPVADGNAAVSQFIRQFRQELVELRRTPISGLLRRLQRVVRDAAKAEDKIVGLELIGEDAGIERSLQQRLYEPLLHIVRNCVCHGIEAPADRQRVGKSESGTISIEARSAADLCVIEIRDDGRGLDYDAIRRRGIQRGLIPADAAVTRQELSQLIFEPGFSTRQQADAIAGRGVGMDVVATTLNRMRGWLEVDSEPGKGTRIRLSFPLPSVIQHVMVFRSNEQLFAIPMPSVQAAGDLRPESRCVDFAAMLDDTPEDVSRYDAGVLLSSDLCSHTDLGTTQITLLVDQVVGPEEVVLRPLPAMLRSHPFCTAASLSGMGETVLILDARRLIQAKRERFQAWRTALPAVTAKPSEKAQRPTILVVDDSLSARRRVVRSLSRYPVEIVEAGDGRQALDLMKQQQFSAVLSDMEMPHVTGMELLAEVRAGRQAAETPFVIISSRQEPEYTDRARQLGVTDYLPKPLADDDLDAVLRQESVRKHLSLPSQSWTPGAIR